MAAEAGVGAAVFFVQVGEASCCINWRSSSADKGRRYGSPIHFIFASPPVFLSSF
jgi:hypothetical protein